MKHDKKIPVMGKGVVMDYISADAASHDLLECFFAECEKHFRFLCEKHGYLSLSGILEYKKNCKIITPYHKGDQLYAPFFAVTRYENNDKAVEIVYGDRQFVLEVFVYTDSVTRLNFNDIILAVEGGRPDQESAICLVEQDNLRQKIQWFAENLEQTPKILNPSEKLIERAMVMRSKLIEHDARKHLKTLLTIASQEAQQAYNKKDYSKVVELLAPYESYLQDKDKETYQKACEKASS